MDTPWHQRTWIIIVLVLFFFPLGLFLAWKHPNWSKTSKWIATGVVIVIAVNVYLDKEETSPLQVETEVVENDAGVDSAEASSSEGGSEKPMLGTSQEAVEEVQVQEPEFSASDIAEARKLIAEVRTLINTGRSMENLRNTEELDLLRECGTKMRTSQARLKDIQDEVSTLNLPSGALFISVAASEAVSCVWCLDEAIEMCDLASESLTLAESSLDELPK